MSDLHLLTPSQFGRIRPYFPLAHGVPRVFGGAKTATSVLQLRAPDCSGGIRKNRGLRFAKALGDHPDADPVPAGMER